MGDPFGVIGDWLNNLLLGWGMAPALASVLLKMSGAAVLATVALLATFFFIWVERKIRPSSSFGLSARSSPAFKTVLAPTGLALLESFRPSLMRSNYSQRKSSSLLAWIVLCSSWRRFLRWEPWLGSGPLYPWRQR